ncbi:hypothetical protein EIP91_009178 [Steccherinum ochraceum]|uniref:Uncharacterized protein n=1 Tax=Steccherinum ochraceum TaxID=92696 RepID=A0A4R0RBP3_9APHY|nr:hypothetical protein EIP91_009178 [Steccherinum ochraceum]
MDEEQAEDPESTLPSAAYLSELLQHIKTTGGHLSGDSGFGLLNPSFLSLSYWTATEKDMFFRGLSVYSRLRPDLIAADIGTKNLMEVTHYIDTLEDAAAEETGLSLFGTDHPRTQGTPWTTIPRAERDSFPIAMEMSRDWCDLEEKEAFLLAKSEPMATVRAKERSREELVEARRLEIRRKKGKGRTEDGVRDRAGEKAKRKDFDAWLEERKQEWEVEDFEASLDGDALAALDAVLRDAEEEQRLASFRSNSSVLPSREASTITDGPSHTLRLEEASSRLIPPAASVDSRPSVFETPATSTAVVSGSPDIDMELIDPALRDPSYGFHSSSTPREPDEAQVHPKPMNAPFHPNTPPFAAAPLPAESIPTTPRQHGTSTLPEDPPSGGSSAVLRDLSPASRRRLRKRMYMRRKRAEKTGGEVNETTTRLKPGRKNKAASSSKAAVDDNDTPVPQRHPHKSGLTNAYKARAAADAVGFGVDKIEEEGFELFRLSNLHKLMRTYNELHGADPEVVSSISASVLAALQGHVVDFVQEVAKRAVHSRLFERQTKARTKVWRISDRPIIRRRNVKHGLGMYVGKKLTKKRHFRHLKRSITLKKVYQPLPTAEGDEEDEEVEEEEPEEVEIARIDSLLLPKMPSTEHTLTFERKSDMTKKRMPLPVRHLSTPRTVAPPFILTPCEWEAEVPSSRQSTLEGRRDNYYPTPWGEHERPLGLDADTLMPEETDEEDFDVEMEEEDEVEVRDAALREAYETELWQKDRSIAVGEEKEEVRIIRTRRKRKRTSQDEDDEDAVEEDENGGGEEDYGDELTTSGEGREDGMDVDEGSELRPPQPMPTRKSTRKTAQGSQRKKIKSKEYISDSDVD